MNAQLGLLHAYLLKHRVIETRPTHRRVRAQERQMADILKELGPESSRNFQEFIDAQGFKLVHYTSEDIPGIALGSEVWLLIRNGQERVADFLSAEPALEAVRLGSESTTQAAVWFLHIYLHYLALV